MSGVAQAAKVVQTAERRMEGVVPAFAAADRIRTSDIVWLALQAVVFAFAILAPNRMNRREVEDIESHVANRGQSGDRVGECAVTTFVVGRRPRKQFVPRGKGCLRPLDVNDG